MFSWESPETDGVRALQADGSLTILSALPTSLVTLAGFFFLNENHKSFSTKAAMPTNLIRVQLMSPADVWLAIKPMFRQLDVLLSSSFSPPDALIPWNLSSRNGSGGNKKNISFWILRGSFIWSNACLRAGSVINRRRKTESKTKMEFTISVVKALKALFIFFFF